MVERARVWVVGLWAGLMLAAPAGYASDMAAMVPAGFDVGLNLGDGWAPAFEARVGLTLSRDYEVLGLGNTWAGLVASGGYSVARDAATAAFGVSAGSGAGLEVSALTDFDGVGWRVRAIAPSNVIGVYVGVETLGELRVNAGLVLTLPVPLD